MRYQPAERLLNVARRLAATRLGMTLDEMAAELGVSRRTAERICQSLNHVFPEMTYTDDEQRLRRWRIPAAAMLGIASPTAEMIATVEANARECEVRGEGDRAALLREASTMLRVVMRPEALAHREPDVEALMLSEGVAMRPGPRPVIAAGVLPALRRALLGMQPIVIRYMKRGEEEAATRILCPYGLLYGGRGWLVAHVEGLPEMRLWRLDRIASVDLLDRTFARREDFDLAAYAAQSFGVFQEEPVDVVLRFVPDVAEDVTGWMFHPTQRIEREADGSSLVRFRAGGLREMCWHLFTWGGSVEILEPVALRTMMAELLRDVRQG